ncbi:MAG: hypothetical protein IJY81_06870 [Lachnospiraceae bacterium]|nr:hypothetical protein [Lachnospiraceae bacterium]
MKGNSIVYTSVGGFLIALWAACILFIQMSNSDSEVIPAGVRSILFAWAIAMLITGICSHVFNNEIKQHCTKITNSIAIMFTAAFSLGLFAYFMLKVMWMFGNSSQRPIAYPVSKATLVIAVIICIVLLCMYIYTRHKNNIKGGYYIDIFKVIIFCIPFMLLYNAVGQIISAYFVAYLS